jgi:hypothetical protein
MEKCDEEARNNSRFFQRKQQKGTVEMIRVKKIREENKVRNKECQVNYCICLKKRVGILTSTYIHYF